MNSLPSPTCDPFSSIWPYQVPSSIYIILYYHVGLNYNLPSSINLKKLKGPSSAHLFLIANIFGFVSNSSTKCSKVDFSSLSYVGVRSYPPVDPSPITIYKSLSPKLCISGNFKDAAKSNAGS